MDIYVLAQALLYLCMCITGLIVSITTGVNRSRFHGECILYASFTDKRVLQGSAASNCDYPIYVSVVGLVIYGMAMCLYHSYVVYKSRQDPNKGSRIWVMPFLMVNVLLTVLMFVAACIVSVGYAVFCTNFLEGLPSNAKCSIGNNKEWTRVGTDKKFNPGNYVTFMNTCMIAAWLSILFLLSQVGLVVWKIYKSRRREVPKAPAETEETLAY